MTIGPLLFDFLFYLLILEIGSNFLISGISVLIYKNILHMPKLLGYLIFKAMKIGQEKYQGKSKFIKVVFGQRAMAYYFLLGGTSYIIFSIQMIILILRKIFA